MQGCQNLPKDQSTCNRLTVSYVELRCCYLWQALFKGACDL